MEAKVQVSGSWKSLRVHRDGEPGGLAQKKGCLSSRIIGDFLSWDTGHFTLCPDLHFL